MPGTNVLHKSEQQRQGVYRPEREPTSQDTAPLRALKSFAVEKQTERFLPVGKECGAYLAEESLRDHIFGFSLSKAQQMFAGLGTTVKRVPIFTPCIPVPAGTEATSAGVVKDHSSLPLLVFRVLLFQLVAKSLALPGS